MVVKRRLGSLGKPNGHANGAGAPKPLSEKAALKYLQKHRIKEFFEEVVAKIVVHHPEDPLAFALTLVEEALHERRTEALSAPIVEENLGPDLAALPDTGKRGSALGGIAPLGAVGPSNGAIGGGALPSLDKSASGDDTAGEESEDEDVANAGGEIKALENQAGGHADAFQASDDGTLTKKCNAGEWTFYGETLAKNEGIKPLVPEFIRVEGSAEDNPRVVLKDLTRGYAKPCIMDIKMGVTSAAPDASDEKRASMEAKDKGSTTVSLGIRVVGLKVWDASKNDWTQYSKPWGKALTDETFEGGMKEYFAPSDKSAELASAFLEKVRAVEAYMKDQSDLLIISSSLLFVYDGEPGADPKCELKMIDFAHVFPLEGDDARDDGYLTGLRNLIPMLESVAGASSD